MDMTPSVGGREFERAWPLISASAIGFGLGLSGLPFYTAGVFLDPLMTAFHWKAAEVQSGLLVMLWSTIVLSPLAGLAVDRFGSRRVACLSILLFGLGFMSLSVMGPDLSTFRLRWVAIAIGGAGTLPLVWGRVVSLRFVARRGLALGLVLAGSGVTGFIAPPLASALIERFGWRAAYAVLGALPILIALPLGLMALPRDHGNRPPIQGGAQRPPLDGVDLEQALLSPRFWLIAICVAIVAASASGCISNLVKILVLHGQARATAVWIASLAGLFVIVGRAASGALIDRFWAPAVAAGFFIAPAAGCLLLLSAPHSVWAGAVAAALIGLAAGAEFDLLAYLLAAYFGLRRYGAIYGCASAVFGFAAGAAPLVFAAVFDRTGAYDLVLKAATLAFLLGGLGLLRLGPYPNAASGQGFRGGRRWRSPPGNRA
jgi:predicted MFS family arabinose efflux permease